MRVSDVARESGIPVPTIKYYLREGLLHRGESTAPNQARYDASHLRRLRLIRALVEVGGVPVATVREVLAAVDDPDVAVHRMLGRVTGSLAGPSDDEPDSPDLAAATARVDELVARHGWTVAAHSPSRRAAAGVLARMQALGQDRSVEQLDEYAQAAHRVAEVDLAPFRSLSGREEIAEAALVGTVLGDALLSALSRMAHADVSAKHFPPPPSAPSPEHRT